jgi:hypothetical protein
MECIYVCTYVCMYVCSFLNLIASIMRFVELSYVFLTDPI